MTDRKKIFLIRDNLGNYPLDQIEPLQRQGYDVVELTPELEEKITKEVLDKYYQEKIWYPFELIKDVFQKLRSLIPAMTGITRRS